jgi:ABC transporter substrate binding protein
MRGLRQGLKEAGYTEGENLTIEYRWANNQIERLPALAADMVRRRVALIATTGGHLAARPVKAATTTIPTIFNIAGDPVQQGLVASLAQPGGNLTGVTILASELGAKRLELLHELTPSASHQSGRNCKHRAARCAGRCPNLRAANSGPQRRSSRALLRALVTRAAILLVSACLNSRSVPNGWIYSRTLCPALSRSPPCSTPRRPPNQILHAGDRGRGRT